MRCFLRLPASTRWFQPAIGGLAIGAAAAVSPAVMGVGYEYVDQALNGGLVFKTLVMLCVMKLVRHHHVLHVRQRRRHLRAQSVHRRDGRRRRRHDRAPLAPFPTGDPGAYALVGMGTLFAGIIRAPMTSVFMIFEITQDYQILVPLMVANLLSFVISRRFQPTPVYHALLEQDHVHLPSPVRVASASWTAADVMNADVAFVPPDSSLQQLLETSGHDGAQGFVIGSRDRLVGVITPNALRPRRRPVNCSSR